MLKGAVLALCATALAASLAAACYGLGGWVVPDPEEGFYGAFLDLMVGFATRDQPTGAVALLVTADFAAVISGALVGRYAAQLAGPPGDRARRLARAVLIGYVASSMAIPMTLGIESGFLRARFEWTIPFLWIYGLVGAVVLSPLAVLPLLAAARLLERWTRQAGDAEPAHRIAALLVGMAALSFLLGTFAARRYLTATWTLTTAAGAACDVQRGMSRRSVRERCGNPTDLGVERDRFTWSLSAPRRCDVPVDAYTEQLVIYDCREEVAGVDLFAARGIHRAFRDDFDASNPRDVKREGEALLELLARTYQISRPQLRVLGARPRRVWEGGHSELFGDYDFESRRIRAWMRTAVLGKVTSFRGLLHTLLHEFAHHLDREKLGFEDTPHTRGFHARVDDLWSMSTR